MNRSVNIRRATVDDAAGIAKDHVDTWRTSYKGVVPGDVLENLSYAQREEWWRSDLSEQQTAVTFIATDESESIIGFSSTGPERGEADDYDGELCAIYLLQAFQGQGIGRQLVASSAKSLLSQGLSSMLVWVLADNPSRKFYEAIGGQPILEKTITMGGKNLLEIGYGWPDLASLVDKLKS